MHPEIVLLPLREGNMFKLNYAALKLFQQNLNNALKIAKNRSPKSLPKNCSPKSFLKIIPQNRSPKSFHKIVPQNRSPKSFHSSSPKIVPFPVPQNRSIPRFKASRQIANGSSPLAMRPKKEFYTHFRRQKFFVILL